MDAEIVDAEIADLADGPELRRDAEVGRVDPATAATAATTVTDLFRAHHLDLVRLAVMMTGDLATAEDVVQDVYERLHRRWPSLRNPARSMAYARACVLNGCRSAHRRSAVSRKNAILLTDRMEVCSDSAGATDDRGFLADALRTLPRRQREILVLRYYCDLDITEIAAVLRIGPSTVRSTMSRGLAALAYAAGEEEQ